MENLKGKYLDFYNEIQKTIPIERIFTDELHLLTGPLGSITGIYESVIEILCTKKGKKPKIISSTATTRNTNEQIKALYGNSRKVNIFPPSGLSYNDSFFAKTSKTESKRRYLGFIPTGKSAIDAQLQMLANLFVARLEVYKAIVENRKKNFKIFDKYWTLVSYYNSLRMLGKSIIKLEMKFQILQLLYKISYLEIIYNIGSIMHIYTIEMLNLQVVLKVQKSDKL